MVELKQLNYTTVSSFSMLGSLEYHEEEPIQDVRLTFQNCSHNMLMTFNCDFHTVIVIDRICDDGLDTGKKGFHSELCPLGSAVVPELMSSCRSYWYSMS